MLPLIGRIADLRGRVPVLVGVAGGLRARLAGHRARRTTCRSMVAGRFLQGVGGGGLVPATLALVADLYPAERRGVPLGVVGAVQELGSVLGPLYGAVVLAVADWRGDLLRSTSPSAWSSPPPSARSPTRRHGAADRRVAQRCRLDPTGSGCLLLAGRRWSRWCCRCCSRAVLVTRRHLGLGRSSRSPATRRWLTPVGLATVVAGASLFVVRCLTARAAAGRPARLVRRSPGEADLRRRRAAGARARPA